jgi:hypothetical protein
MVYKESPLCSQGPAFGLESAESLSDCLINLLPKSFGALSVCLSPPATTQVESKNKALQRVGRGKRMDNGYQKVRQEKYAFMFYNTAG